MRSLAEDLLLVAIDPATGVLRCRGNLRYGLMGAELLALVSSGLIEEANGQIYVLAGGGRSSGDPDADGALVGLVAAKRPPRIRVWVSRPRRLIMEDYLDRLIAANAIRREGGRFRARWPVADHSRAAALRTRLDTIAFGSGAVDPPEVAFAGLVTAVGLERLIYRASDQRQVRKRLREICKSNAITEAVHRAASSSDAPAAG
jgi:Golgi phosphoprotein 3 (GPP34)